MEYDLIYKDIVPENFSDLTSACPELRSGIKVPSGDAIVYSTQPTFSENFINCMGAVIYGKSLKDKTSSPTLFAHLNPQYYGAVADRSKRVVRNYQSRLQELQEDTDNESKGVIFWKQGEFDEMHFPNTRAFFDSLMSLTGKYVTNLDLLLFPGKWHDMGAYWNPDQELLTFTARGFKRKEFIRDTKRFKVNKDNLEQVPFSIVS